MAGISPEKVQSLVTRTLRHDSQIVLALKEFYGWRCQFPGCGVRIPTRDGGFYAEVAHILPVHKGGQSVLGNLLVLCPNHHKEFDHGYCHIFEQSRVCLHGSLNGREFLIRFDWAE